MNTTLREKIEKKYVEAVKSKNIEAANTLRLIKSAIKDKDIENRTNKSVSKDSDQQILSVLQNLVKLRKDSIDSFKIAKRDDLIAKEEYEITLISQFLPQQLTQEETEKIIINIIKEENLSSLKDMGSLMNILKKDHSGSIDMSLAGKIAKTILKN